jgi:hypothetical protein
MQYLDYVRVATEDTDNANGYLYIHHWPTGWQQLVFPSKSIAETWIIKINHS